MTQPELQEYLQKMVDEIILDVLMSVVGKNRDYSKQKAQQIFLDIKPKPAPRMSPEEMQAIRDSFKK